MQWDDDLTGAGPLARIGPDTLVTSDPDLLRRILGVRTKYRRSDWYYAMRFDPAKDNVLSMRDDDLHNELRAKMAAGVSAPPRWMSCLRS